MYGGNKVLFFCETELPVILVNGINVASNSVQILDTNDIQEI